MGCLLAKASAATDTRTHLSWRQGLEKISLLARGGRGAEVGGRVGSKGINKHDPISRGLKPDPLGRLGRVTVAVARAHVIGSRRYRR